MDFARFKTRLQQWEHLHFTSVELQQRDGRYEIYATAAEHQTLSQLFICNVSNESAAQEEIKQLQSWLQKIKSGRSKRLNARPARQVTVNVPGMSLSR
ncbi:hypothetical protein [Pantoea eucrina]|uniref:hypothetical protein n=1 Tax=Pantoea eucrina TaxID=472693 RepID=UPI00080F3C03|nr:hypothetical protein [Pantoea eucrina]